MAGFYHSDWESDEVTCFNCRVSIDHWDHNDDPFQEHLLASPHCTFVNKSSMGTLEERLGSFHAWPLDTKPLPVIMAAAGFFHSDEQTDTVTCFCCMLRLDDWKLSDDPIRRHVMAKAQAGPCLWLDKILTEPEHVTTPVPRQTARVWDHKQTPRKCQECRKVFSSGNQFHKHKRESHAMVRRRARPRGIPGQPVKFFAMRGIQRPINPATRTRASFLGTHKVTKVRAKARMPKIERSTSMDS